MWSVLLASRSPCIAARRVSRRAAGADHQFNVYGTVHYQDRSIRDGETSKPDK